MAQAWLDKGARRLHLVDLNGAFAGKPINERAIKSIVDVIGGQIPNSTGGRHSRSGYHRALSG